MGGGAQTDPAAPPNISTSCTTSSLGAEQAIFGLLTLAPTQSRPCGLAEKAGHRERADWLPDRRGSDKRGRLDEMDGTDERGHGVRRRSEGPKERSIELMRILDSGIMRSSTPALIKSLYSRDTSTSLLNSTRCAFKVKIQ